MTIRLDVSTDFEEVCNDFHESATLRIAGVDITLPQVLTEPYTIKELEPAGAQVTRNGTLFVWSKSRSSKPPLGSIIIDHEGYYWTIWKLEDKQHVECWEAFGLDLNIITADANEATILKATYRKAEANEARAVWKGYVSDATTPTAADVVRARFQPSAETAQLEFGADTSLEVYRVYFDGTVPSDLAGGEYRLLDSQGNRYRVLKYYNENRIDRLPVAIATRITEGSEFWDLPGS